MAAIQIGFLLLGIGIPGGLILLWFLQRQNQQKQLREIMLSIGFEPQPHPDPNLEEQIQQHYPNRTTVQLKQVFKKDTPDETVYLCDIQSDNEDGESGKEESHTVCLLQKGGSLPEFFMIPRLIPINSRAEQLVQGIINLLAGKAGLQEIDFLQHGRFANRYQVFGKDAQAVIQCLHPEVLDNLADTQNWMVRAGGNLILFNTQEIRSARQLTREQISEHIRAALQFARWIA